MLMSWQAKITPKKGMPVELTNVARKLQNVSAEVIQLYYINAWARTIDAGQAIGVGVTGKAVYSAILDATGYWLGRAWDTSLSFTSTALTTEDLIDQTVFEAFDNETIATKVDKLTENLANGHYIVDYRSGTIYGKKASVTVTLTAGAYKVNSLLVTTIA